jgi:hypothetical protein
MPKRVSGSWPALLLFYLAPCFLLIDSISGALQQLPVALPWSLFFKALLLSLMVWQLILWRDKTLLLLLGLLLLALAGPAYSYLILPVLKSAGPGAFVRTELSLLLKIVAPLLAFSFYRQFYQRYPVGSVVMTDRLMLLSFMVILLNLALGLAGFGDTAYQPMDNVEQPFLGVKGFFYSTNELSAVLLVVSGWLLWRSWPHHKACYVTVGLLTIGSAMLLLTKTGLLGSILLVTFVPLLSARPGFWRQRFKLLLTGLMLTMAVFVLLLVWYAEPFLRTVGLYDKLAYAYEQRGLAGILLSSRDVYLTEIWQQTEQHYSQLHRVFGVGVAGVSVLLKKYFIEIDLFDLMVFYGLAGVLIFSLTFGRFIYSSCCRLANHPLAATVLFINVLLLGVAMFAGHILTSGMLWLPWALINAAVFDQGRLTSFKTRELTIGSEAG